MKDLIIQKIKAQIVQKQNEQADAFIATNSDGTVESLNALLQKISEGSINTDGMGQ